MCVGSRLAKIETVGNNLALSTKMSNLPTYVDDLGNSKRVGKVSRKNVKNFLGLYNNKGQ
jgi:hypothetical protein